MENISSEAGSSSAQNTNGIGAKHILIGLAILLALALLTYLLIPKETNNPTNQNNNTPNSNTNTNNNNNTVDTRVNQVTNPWVFENDKWVATNGNPPTCPNPLLLSPVDLTKATGVLYPGQFRGPYKAHGGINFNGDNTTNDIKVVLPMDGTLIRASRYIQTGEIQYLLEFMHPCGVIVRFDHLLTLTPTFQTIIETLPEPKINDSTTIDIKSDTLYKAGDEVATQIGFADIPTSTFDFGVYDLRTPNSASKDPKFAAGHKNANHVDYYAICWLEEMSDRDMALLKKLPVVSSESGRYSDYCNK